MEKTITLDTKYLNTEKQNKPTSSKIKMRRKSNNGLTRKKLIQKMKLIQSKNNKQEENVSHNESNSDELSKDNFTESLHALDQLVKHYYTRKNKNKKKTTSSMPTIKHVVDESGFENCLTASQMCESTKKEHNITPRTIYEPDGTPKYGCLKFGTKPTYRQINKTKRNPHILFPKTEHIKHTTTIDVIDEKLQNRKNRFDVIQQEVRSELYNNTKDQTTRNNYDDTRQNKMQCNTISTQIIHPESIVVKDDVHSSTNANITPSIHESITRKLTTNIPDNTNVNPTAFGKRIHRVKKTRKIGKSGNKVLILIDNNRTRKKKTDELVKLDNIPLSKVKLYLRSKQLIKPICSAPEYVLREMMKNSILSGNVSNHPDTVTVEHLLDKNKSDDLLI